LHTDPIEHIVVLMLENRSFDQMLGSLKSIYPELEGVDATDEARVNRGDDPARTVAQRPVLSRVTKLDPMHETQNVLRQIADGCSGFIADFLQAYPQATDQQLQDVMGYYPVGPGSLTVLHTLARSFTVCDHWFCSVPGPTWTNRLFLHTGTSLGRVEMPGDSFDPDLHCYDQPTIYQLLHDAGRSWKIYHHGLPQSLVLTRQWEYLDHYRDVGQFYADAAGPAEAFPGYVFIEPDYCGPDQNDQHPPSDVMNGEALLARVYNALRANEALWHTSLLVILYDEHGGFYDHVVPPPAVRPDDHTEEFTFDRLGVRVPALLISPWVAPGVVPDVFDHTSLLRYLSDKWSLALLGNRTAQANSFADALLALDAARTDAPPSVPVPAVTRSESSQIVLDANGRALVGYGQRLQTQAYGRDSLTVPISTPLGGQAADVAAIEAAKAGFARAIRTGQASWSRQEPAGGRFGRA
jgi:phospholipase C